MTKTRFQKKPGSAPVAHSDLGFMTLYDPDDFLGETVYVPEEHGGGEATIIGVGRIPCPRCPSRHAAKAWQLEGDLLLVECVDTERFFWCSISE